MLWMHERVCDNICVCELRVVVHGMILSVLMLMLPVPLYATLLKWHGFYGENKQNLLTKLKLCGRNYL